jgi:hypothetical protein
VKRIRLLLPIALVAACATIGSRQAAERSEWVLVRTPMTENLGIPIYAWERVRMFPSAEECSIYRMELLENAVSAGSRTKLEEVYRLHCLPAAKMVPPKAE